MTRNVRPPARTAQTARTAHTAQAAHPAHCCAELARRVDPRCASHPDPVECPDAVVAYSARFREYGLRIADGGTAVVLIRHCPWCGERLPASLRDRWFDTLEARGIDPDSDAVPPEFADDTWWRAGSE